MTISFRFIAALSLSVLSASRGLAETALDKAEVNLPYEELRRLIEAARAQEITKPVTPPSLSSSRLKLLLDGDAPVIDAEFQAFRDSEGFSRVPLIGGDVSAESHEGDGGWLVVNKGMICQIGERAGVSDTNVRLRITSTGGSFKLVLPPCPGTSIDTSGLPEDAAIGVTLGGAERIISSGVRLALPADAGEIRFRLLDQDESTEALRPPEPSEWIWQHQALVVPVEGELHYCLLAHASATGGSAVESILRLPSDARRFTATGDDLLDARTSRDAEGNPLLHLKWKTRDVMERDLEIQYRIPVRPLDDRWTLKVPVGESSDSTRSRFIIPSSASIEYAADGLSAPITSDSVVSGLSRYLGGSSCQVLESGASVEVTVRRLPVVATEDAVVSDAGWVLSMEPDGSMLLEGNLQVDHAAAQGVVFDTPEGMNLLSCRVSGRQVDPVNLGEGRIEVAVPAPAKKGSATLIAVSFTGKSEAFDPLEGTLALALPQTPLFIRSLMWRIDMPDGYTAEIHGNLTRVVKSGSDPASSIRMRKNLCRDERPEVRVFYQSRNLLP